MQFLEDYQKQQGGFTFDNVKRNQHLADQKVAKLTEFKKTGTTIVGVIYKDGVVIAADTRATAGTIVADKNCEKIDYIAPNIYCCGAGTAADTFYMKHLMASQLELMRFNQNRQSRLSTVVMRCHQKLFQYQGHIGAALIIGGYDYKGPQLCSISPQGYYTYLPYVSMGSGSLNAMAVLESLYKDDMTQEEAKDLAIRAIEAGIIHDLGSGSNVDCCVITKDKTDFHRNIRIGQSRQYVKQFPYEFPKGNTPFFRQVQLKFEKQDVTQQEKEKMELI